MTSSIFWYDYETTGINPRCDRPIQVAGIRTDEALNEIAEPLNLYCRLSDDILPHPAACLVTGIEPQRLAEAAHVMQVPNRYWSAGLQLTTSKRVFAQDQIEIVFSSVNQRKVVGVHAIK